MTLSFESDSNLESVTAVAVAVRGPGSKSESSPNISPGPRIESKFSRPSVEVVPSFSFPSTTTYNRSPPSPSLKSVLPFVILTGIIDSRSVAEAASSSALNNGALRTSASSLFCFELGIFKGYP